jgi:hypothetical protein
VAASGEDYGQIVLDGEASLGTADIFINPLGDYKFARFSRWEEVLMQRGSGIFMERL